MASGNQHSYKNPRLQELVQRGDDFCKVGLFGFAVANYKKAWTLEPGDSYILHQIDYSKNQSEQNRKKITIVSIIVVIVFALGILIF
jgi:hypothetical protein